MATQVREETVSDTQAHAAPGHTTTIIERRSGGSTMTAVILLLALIVAGYFGLQYLQQGQVRTDAIAGAADQVGDAAQQVGDAAQDAAQRVGR